MEATYFWIIIYSCLIFGTGVLCDRKLERRQAVSSCSVNNDDMFYCSNKMCIEWSSVCDGYKDCSDGSDETRDTCARYEYGTNMTMACGRVHIQNQVISKKGNKEVKEAMVGTAPWYVRILKLYDDTYIRMCGGTIIAPNVVISEASYFWEEGMKSMKISVKDGLYIVSVGKYTYKNFKVDQDTDFHKKMNVKIIYLREGYNGTGNEDIAVIVLANKISFSNGFAAPVCIDWNGQYNVFNGDQGKVIVRDLSDDVEPTYFERNSSYINSITCQKLYPTVYSEVTSYEKFCAYRKLEPLYSYQGLGITFLHSNSHFLTGVNTRYDEDTNERMVQQFIDLRFYVHWIRGIINKHVTVNSCVLPTVEGVVYSYEDSNEILPHGTLIDNHLNINENCEVGYHKAYPSRFRFCQGKGKWLTNSEKLCFKMCPPLESDSLDIKCSHNGKYANCSNLSIPDTIARLSCKSTHSAPNGKDESPLQLICQSNGMWNKPLYTCNPNCGRVYIEIKLLINNGTKALVGTAPWNVGIYRFDKKKSNHDLICGGSIISPNLVVSAAHCFWNQGMLSNTISISDGLYKIAVGKYDRNFSIIDNEFTKIINVKIVYLTEGYNGHTGSYFEDIAVILLEKRVPFSDGVTPVCIDWNGEYKEENGDHGKIVGWGKTENASSSPILLEASLPYIDRSTCRGMYKNEFERYVTVDKFCAGSALGQGVGSGDSGAGLCFLHSDSYYLTGVVSSKDTDKNYSIATFTEIKYHIEWIRGLFDRYNKVK
ncbi:uncharacterized protein LOC100166859 isoform X3 [Acyrthosiphon pisum]|nr:uncharacterized protein LOC100166859 isoform X3 [Acyrthosiphon pisum]XP_016659043.1 uncharacterized protein LOC100166859 isoform X3 [Acyrthosiphon pisum]|eukprot:XP_016659042.1 PREDICTED: uncharacterized protein LOC100166859 isoform X3 [Acyrthosiphon pisum]